jgi:HlyD family secretion protein
MRRIRPGLWLLGLGAVVGTLLGLRGLWADQGLSEELQKFPRAVVQRVDLDIKLTAPGKIESQENTLIECELEALRARAAGGSMMNTTGFSTIIDLTPEGTIVRKGDLLCRFDSSEYAEIVRQQSIVVEGARSDLRRAELDLQAAEIQLQEYLNGTRLAQYKTLEGQIALREAELQRQLDRMEWSDRLLPLGYISQSTHSQERQLLERAEITLQRSRDALATYKKYTEYRITQTFESQVARRISSYDYLKNRLAREEDQLAHHEDQLARCEVRAPHDGMLIYANEDDDDPRIQIGSQLKFKMDMFILPNPEKMEVKTTLNETIVRHVSQGMATSVAIEALPGRIFPGKVISVSRLPDMRQSSWRKSDIRDYEARVQLINPVDLLPGMNANVEIITDNRPASLVVPSEAVGVETDGASYCYVARSNVVERRPVTVERGTVEVLRITSGLEEGEQVVLNPDGVDLGEIRVVEAERRAPADPPVQGQTEVGNVVVGALTR